MEKQLIEFLWQAVHIIPALVGGFVRYIHEVSKNREDFNFMRLTFEVIIAGFVGWIVFHIYSSFWGIDELTGVAVGISSFMSRELLDILEKYLPKAIKKAITKKLE